MSSPFAFFTCLALDQLIFPIYQGINRFVVISSVTQDEWVLHLGLQGSKGRWWRGVWKEADVIAITGKISDNLLETFAENLARSMCEGDMFIGGGGGNTEPNAEVKLIVSPSSNKPSHISLVELSPEKAASYAAQVFMTIAVQAQSRKNQLHAPVDTVTIPRAETLASTSSSRPTASASDEKTSEYRPKKAAERPKSNKRKESEPPEEESKPKVKATPKPIKGASLANPNKKARKFQRVEFGSDED